MSTMVVPAALARSLEIGGMRNTDSLRLQYGTAGFRAPASALRGLIFRCGLLAVVRSWQKLPSQPNESWGPRDCTEVSTPQNVVVGLCITASHNSARDNGVKIVAPSGGALEPEMERLATEFVNSDAPVVEAFKTLVRATGTERPWTALLAAVLDDLDGFALRPKPLAVILGRDSRGSSPELAAEARTAVEALGCRAIDVGEVTTPQLHFFTQQINLRPDMFAGVVPEQFCDVYFAHFLSRFAALVRLAGSRPDRWGESPGETLLCDAAFGVGGLHVVPLQALLTKCLAVNLQVFNAPFGHCRAMINEGAGSEFIRSKVTLPSTMHQAAVRRCATGEVNLRCCSLDGDADRIVYFIVDALVHPPRVTVLDGDRIATLFSLAITRMLQDAIASRALSSQGNAPATRLRFGVVQTPYSNGASTAHMKQAAQALYFCGVDMEVAMARTGVKNLERKADTYHLAVFFESNGHGTVKFNRAALHAWATGQGVLETEDYAILLRFLALFNESTGDSITNLLGVEFSLRYLKMGTMDWARLYSELPSDARVVPLARKDLDEIVTDPEDESVLKSPPALAQAVAASVAKGGSNCRAFIRASGTESVCRVYGEAPSKSLATCIVDEIVHEIKKYFASSATRTIDTS